MCVCLCMWVCVSTMDALEGCCQAAEGERTVVPLLYNQKSRLCNVASSCSLSTLLLCVCVCVCMCMCACLMLQI